jgi:hypothetical protein
VNAAVHDLTHSPVVADAESSLVSEPHRIGTKAYLLPPLDPKRCDLGAGSASAADSEIISAPLQPIANDVPVSNNHFPLSSVPKVGPKTPLTPVAPTRHVRQWLVRQATAEQLQPKPQEPFFIRRSTKAQTVFYDTPSSPSFDGLFSNVPFSNTSSSVLLQDDVNPHMREDKKQILLSFSSSDPNLSSPAAHAKPQPPPHTHRLPPTRDRDLTKAIPVVVNAPAPAPARHAEKVDALSIHRAAVLRELDAALRAQWPLSFQRTVQVRFCGGGRRFRAACLFI